MTLQERYDAARARFQSLAEQAQQVRTQGIQLDQQLIRADAEMKLLEDLLSPQPATDLPPVPAMTLVEPKKRGRKPKESAA